MLTRSLTLVCIVAILSFTTLVQAADWGNLKGRIVFDGPAPKPEPSKVNKDTDFCGKHGLVDESLLVNPKNGGVANVAVWLYLSPRSRSLPPIHDSYAKSEKGMVTLKNEKCRFEPHVATVRAGQILQVSNPDPVGHNTKIDSFANPPLNQTIPAGAKLDVELAEAERVPARVSCSIHPWMYAWVVVQKHPYMAVTDKDGNFEIKNLPAGDWTFQFWHEKSGYVSSVNVGGTNAEWARGRTELSIKAGDKDLGTIKVKPSLFED